MPANFYASHSVWSEPGTRHDGMMGGCATPEAIARWIASFVQHPRGTESAAKGFSDEQAADLELRSVAEMLAEARRRYLPDGEAPGAKIGGVCRDFALLAVSAFRERGIPARLRVGFADYLAPDRWEDHWLCEWCDGGNWKRLDVELAAAGKVSFDPLDVPHERFLTAGEAWLRIRHELSLAPRFGVSSLGLGGEWFVAGSLFREMAALRKVELKPWDYWGLVQKLPRVPSEWPQGVRQMLDGLASRLKNADDETEAIESWPLPKQVVSFPHGEAMIVVLPSP